MKFSRRWRGGVLAVLGLLTMAHSSVAAQEWLDRAGAVEERLDNTNFLGGDLATISVRAFDPELCARMCIRARLCVGYTLARKREPDGQYLCFLKQNLPPPTPDRCCTSGQVTRK